MITDGGNVILLGELTPTDMQECDWGWCNDPATAVRWCEEHSEWLSVCIAHQGGA